MCSMREVQCWAVHFDDDRPRWRVVTLVDSVIVAERTFHEDDPENWRLLDNLQSRYTAGALRHIFAHMDGEKDDPESNISHLAHALCCLLFKLEIELENAQIKEEEPREADTAKHTARDQSFESDLLTDKAYNEAGSMQHIKHLVQYYKT